MKNKKNIIALLLVAIIGIVGLTVAYFSNSTSITNEFETSEYGTDVTETFTSPTGWQPGDETPKVLTVKNTGEVDEAVRVKVEEKWVNKNGEELPLLQDGNVAALIHYINDSDWTKVDVANEDYYYYYYNYKLAPDEETSELLDKVTFNPLINASTTCTDSIGINGETIRSCQSNGSGYDGATYTLKFTIETVQYNKYKEAWNVDVAIAEEKPHPGTLTLLEKTNPVSITNYADGNIHEMYTFEHEATAQTPALTDYRYIGNDPYNYVYFNCDSLDNQNSETCEVWRIIGVFDVEREIDDEENPGEKKTITEKRMKLVRESLIKNDYWNTIASNDWGSSSLNVFLNNDFFNRSGDAISNGLKKSSREMIDNAIFYLGGVYNIDQSSEKIYSWERGSALCGACGTDINKLSWQGKIGLMYPSDEYMVYGKNIERYCYDIPKDCNNTIATKGWTYNAEITQRSSWFLSSSVGSSQYVTLTLGNNLRMVFNAGNYYVNYTLRGVRPVVYLSSSVQIFDGDGSEQNPYKLKK